MKYGRRPAVEAGQILLALLAMGLALFLAWRLVTGAFDGFKQALGLAGRTSASPTVSLRRTYVVSRGDSVSSIAARFGIPPSTLLEANHLRYPNLIFPGERLVVPAPYHPWLTKRTLAETAKQFGVDPAFAMAIGDQESGFNENAISPTGAIGVMQIEPGTATIIAGDMGRSLDLGVETDNIIAGTYWLRYLVRYYGGDEGAAAAAYYEGQSNLAHHGYLNGTSQYVADVMALRRTFSNSH